MEEWHALAAYGASFIIAILVAGHYYYDNQFKYFARLGLKNPKPLPVLGNLLSIVAEDRMEREKRHVAECGKFYGVFVGANPQFVVADPELLKQICIKDFDKFPNHEASELLNYYQHRQLFFRQDDSWKEMRVLLTPTFTSSKLKSMYKLLDACADDLVDCFRGEIEGAITNEAIVDLKKTYSSFTVDGIASCGCGLKLDRKNRTIREDIIDIVDRMLDLSRVRILLASSVSIKLLEMLGFKLVPTRKFEPLAERVRRIIEARRVADKKVSNYLQLLLDANHKQDQNRIELNEMSTREGREAGSIHDDSPLADQKPAVDYETLNKGRRERRLSQGEILANAIVLFFDGHETVATLLTNCTYALAFHPDIQQRLYEEIESIAELNATKTGHVFDYDTLIGCKYLDAFISETFRALSPVLRIDRVAKEDYYVKKYDVTIPKNSVLSLAYYAIMNDPDNWPEPEKFDPDRLMPERRDEIVPGSYCPFGFGPRQCIGMRFALLEAKLGLAKVIMKYKFEPAPGTRYPPKTKPELLMNLIKDSRVVVKLRD